MRILKPTIATTTTMTTTLGSPETLGCHYQRGGDIALTRGKSHNPPRVGVGSAEQPTDTKTERDKQNSSKDSSCTEDL